MLLLCAFLVGLVAGLRSMLAPAIVSWSAHLNLLNIKQTYVELMSYRITVLVFTLLAILELIADKWPKTPSRTQPPSFIVRILSGGLVGATVGASGGRLVFGLVLGAAGAVVGTLGGAAARAKLASAFHADFPAAILEDLAAFAIAIFPILGLQ
jgi:uncharacterized membrane protein